MRLYRRLADGLIVGTQKEAGAKREELDVPTDKAGLIEWLNTNASSSGNCQCGNLKYSGPCIQGRHDAERGVTTNPYRSPDLRAEWARCHDETVEAGLGKLPRFGLRAMPRNAPRPARKRAKSAPTKQKRCTTARCRANRNREKGLLG